MDTTAQAPHLSWHGFGLTDPGLVRATNQDSFAVDNAIGLWIVADGMGGHAGGATASQLAVSAVADSVRTASESRSHIGETDGIDRVREAEHILASAIVSADSLIRTRSAADINLAGMGTTIVAGLLCPGPAPSIVVAHIGDSRAYLIRNRTIHALTLDHSFTQRLVTEKRISPEQAKTHPQQHVLLRAVGAEEPLPPEIHTHRLEPFDMLLLCTDGLTKMLTDQEILDLVLASTDRPRETCHGLITSANERGGKDNTTVVLVTAQTNLR